MELAVSTEWLVSPTTKHACVVTIASQDLSDTQVVVVVRFRSRSVHACIGALLL